jgi:hypothetical protein
VDRPLCFSSFKFLKEISEQVVNIKEGKSFDEIVKDVSVEKEAISDPGLQSPSFSDFQSSGENSEPETEFETLECNSVPLDYNSFQILKEESAENFQENANCLPLCFASLLRKHCKQIVHRKKEECSNASVEEKG